MYGSARPSTFRILDRQELSIQLLRSILRIERLITSEIQQFASLKIFPSQELALIRKEIKAFKEHQEEVMQSNEAVKVFSNLLNDSSANSERKTSKRMKRDVSGNINHDVLNSMNESYDNLVSILQEEIGLCEQKLILLSKKRENEIEARIIYNKKLAKMKAIEDMQSKDPANFRNQMSRF